MIHFGLIKGESNPPPRDVPVPHSTNSEDYHLSPADGIYESFFEVGDEVKRGELLGQVHFPEKYNRQPELVKAETSGILICRRFPAGTNQGDCLAVIARPMKV